MLISDTKTKTPRSTSVKPTMPLHEPRSMLRELLPQQDRGRSDHEDDERVPERVERAEQDRLARSSCELVMSVIAAMWSQSIPWRNPNRNAATSDADPEGFACARATATCIRPSNHVTRGAITATASYCENGLQKAGGLAPGAEDALERARDLALRAAGARAGDQRLDQLGAGIPAASTSAASAASAAARVALRRGRRSIAASCVSSVAMRDLRGSRAGARRPPRTRSRRPGRGRPTRSAAARRTPPRRSAG